MTTDPAASYRRFTPRQREVEFIAKDARKTIARIEEN